MTSVVSDSPHVWTMPTPADLLRSVRMDRVVAAVAIVTAGFVLLGLFGAVTLLSLNGKEAVVLTGFAGPLLLGAARVIIAWRTGKQPPPDVEA